MKRRAFLGFSASAAAIAFINAHSALAVTGCSPARAVMGQQARITMLRLLTTTPLATMKKFYAETIGFPVSEMENELIVHAGETMIHFIPAPSRDQRPFYHFAFNIPENKIQKAFEWQGKRTSIIHPSPDGVKNEIVNFAHWNAHSVFFLDPAGNLLEYIARHDLDNEAAGDFSINDILYASEIAFIVDDVIASGNLLQKEMELAAYRNGDPGFWPIGDESGLLLMIRKGRIWAGYPGLVNETTIFKTSVNIRSGSKKNWTIPGYPYELSAV